MFRRLLSGLTLLIAAFAVKHWGYDHPAIRRFR